ncbi:peptidoglycan-binding protein [Aquamicrobium soli]|uniref:Peptidoglycan-binding protein n=1 Tax=Aquamicrobium soli TaxID=1811518 RepID=A0ABV7KFT4_9HYPH
MNTKRSYLDTLNAGRQHKSLSALDQLNQSLKALEEQIGRSRQASAEPRNPEPRRAYPPMTQPAGAREGEADGPTAAGRIAGELRGLREELRSQMTSGLHREFEALRQDIGRAAQSSPAARDSAELGREFERLSGAIQALAEKSDDRNINSLRLEMEQVRAALDILAREQSVQSVGRRFDDFDRRWSAFETRVDANAGKQAGDDAIAMLAERLEQIGNAVNNLPESLSLRSLEEKVRTLAGAVDHFVSRESDGSGNTLAMIDERLDEISRAIVASSVAAQNSSVDPEALDRIERRIDSLAAQIEEVTADRQGQEMMARLTMLSAHVDDLAAQTNLPQQAMERLAQQIALIADKIDHAPVMPDPDMLFHGLEQRFEALSAVMDRRQGDVLEQSTLLFQDLERRLDEVVARLDQRGPEAQIASAGIMDAIDARFSAFAERLDASAALVASIDPDLIRSLEAQVNSLSAHLAQTGAQSPEFEAIAPRLDDIEQALAATQNAIVHAAREAAENAVRSLAGSNADSAAVSGLAEDLKMLETLTRRSDERNSRTFEAIHDTLLKIVDRLGSLEQAAPLPEPKITVHNAPSMEVDQPSLLLAEGMATLDATTPVREPEAMVRTPAQAAAEAAMAALGSDPIAEPAEKSGRRKSMLGGLSRAFRKKRPETPSAEEPAAAAETPAVDLDEPLDPRLANQPLEPGSGAPDLSAIMKRVRDERGQAAGNPASGDASQSDFIAAARRAAQAAAAEADAQKRQSSLGGPVRALRIGDMLKARRKPILMATTAIALALAGTLLGKALLADSTQTAASNASPIVAEQHADVAAATDAGEPAAATTELQASPGEGEAQAAPAQKTASADAPAPVHDAQPADEAAPDRIVTTPAAEATPAEAATIEIPAEAPHEAVHTAAFQPSAFAPTETTGAVATPAAAAAAVATTQPSTDIPADAGPQALRDAAAQGDAKALFEIGSRYAEARGVKEDMAAAAKWYEKSAERGFAPAEYRIGNFYEKGIGVERDIPKAKTWYQLAAAQGNASAMHNLAVLFAMATDGAPDNEAAARWFQAAADLGVKDSQFNLGILAAKGVGMKQNLEEAYKWFSLVADAGDKDAAAKRDEIAHALRPEQLERARAAAKLWKAKPIDEAVNAVDIPASWQDADPAVTASIDMKKAVQNIQRILNKNGYEAGGADGVMGEKTKNAIMAFQSDNELPPTGEVDEKLVKALLAKK